LCYRLKRRCRQHVCCLFGSQEWVAPARCSSGQWLECRVSWNAELAVKNIESTVKRLNLDLVTHVINWEEFRDVQLAFFRAGVIDLEMPTDHAIGVALYRWAKRFELRTFLSGTNLATEAMMPAGWFYRNKLDSLNLTDILRRYGSGRELRTFPLFRLSEYIEYRYVAPIRVISFLNFFHYDKAEAVELLRSEIGYVPYPIKHYESVFTRFYQGYILPVKFGVDKRKPFLSTLIMSNQISRESALLDLEKPPYDIAQLRQDRRFVLKKLGLSEEEFQTYLNIPAVDHSAYRSINSVEDVLRFIKRKLLGISAPLTRNE
jgi:hypothetical protein